MPTHPSQQLPITWNQVAAFRLARHHLMRRAPASADAVASVAGDIGGVQAQLVSAAYIGLWSRVSDLEVADIEQAISARSLVKAACMRQTQFLVPAEQLAIFTRGAARRAEKEIHWTRRKGVPDRTIDAAIAAALAVLDQPLTRPEIAERVSRYLGAYGPATAADFALWSGMTLTDARQIWAGQQSGFTQVNVEGWTAEILTRDVKALAGAGAGFEQPVIRLLPYLDTFLLGHKEREHLSERQHHPSIYRPQGWIAPVVLVDGRAVATWEYARQGQQLRLKVSGFAPLSPGIATGIQAEALDLGRFLGAASVDVQVG